MQIYLPHPPTQGDNPCQNTVRERLSEYYSNTSCHKSSHMAQLSDDNFIGISYIPQVMLAEQKHSELKADRAGSSPTVTQAISCLWKEAFKNDNIKIWGITNLHAFMLSYLNHTLAVLMHSVWKTLLPIRHPHYSLNFLRRPRRRDSSFHSGNLNFSN